MPTIKNDKIEDFRKLVANKPREDALKYIAGLPPESTVPIILAILENGLPELKKLPEQNKESIESAEYAIGLLSKIAKLQTASYFSKLSALNEIRGSIKSELATLQSKVNKVRVTQDIAALWAEAEIWLQGWYEHTYSIAAKLEKGVPQKNANGQYKIYDTEDRVLNSVAGITKLQAAESYQAIAAEIKRQLDAIGYSRDKAKAANKPAAMLVMQQEKEKEKEKETDAKFAEIAKQITLQAKGNSVHVIIKALNNDDTVLQRLKESVVLFVAAEEGVVSTNYMKQMAHTAPDDEALANALNKFANASDDAKFAILQDAMEKCGFTDNQERLLGIIKGQALAKFNGYINKPYRIPGTQIPVPFFSWEHCHVDKARKVIIDLESTDDVKQQLATLFELRNTLEGLNSHRLLTRVNDVLTSAYRILQEAPTLRPALVSAGAGLN